MMTNKTFSGEMKAVLEIASTLLSESDTEETRMYVQHKLKEVQIYLQEKQRQSEKTLEERIEKEQKSIEELEERIALISDGMVTENKALDYLQMFVDLKDNEWDEAFNALLEDEKNPVEKILKLLIDILKITFEECRRFQSSQTKELAIEARYAETTRSGKTDLKGLTPEQEAELRGHVKYLQDKTAQYCVQSISEKLLDTVKSIKTVEPYYRKYSKNERVDTALDEYIKKCIQFSWVAHFEETPVLLITEPKKECPKILDQFVEHKRVPSGKFVEWPALVRNVSLKVSEYVVKVPWHLYDRERRRPKAKPRKMPTPPPERETEARTEDINTYRDYDDRELESRSTHVDSHGDSIIHLPGSHSQLDNEPTTEQIHETNRVSSQTSKPHYNQARQTEPRSRSSKTKPQMTMGNRPVTRATNVADQQTKPPSQPGNKSVSKKTKGEPRTHENTNF